MSKEAAILFLKKMREDESFREYIENLGLDEQKNVLEQAGFYFTPEELALSIVEGLDSQGAGSENSDILRDTYGGYYQDFITIAKNHKRKTDIDLGDK